MRNYFMKERLTWQEICQKYPNQQVGLADVEWLNNDGVTVKSAVVDLTEDNHSRRDIISLCAMSKGRLYSQNTTPESSTNTGVCIAC